MAPLGGIGEIEGQVVGAVVRLPSVRYEERRLAVVGEVCRLMKVSGDPKVALRSMDRRCHVQEGSVVSFQLPARLQGAAGADRLGRGNRKATRSAAGRSFNESR